MSPFLRVEMLLVAVAVLVMVFRSINRRRLRVQFSLVWLAVAAGMVLVAAFPGIAFRLCGLTRIEEPSNLIYLLGILTLLVIVFKQTEIISQHTEQIKRLTQELSIGKLRLEEQSRDQEK